MKKRLLSLFTILALAVTFSASFAMADGNAYAAGKTKKYYLPAEVRWTNYAENTQGSLTKIKYDKYGNITYGLIAENIPMKFVTKYRNKKGTIASVTYGEQGKNAIKTYDKKGRITKEDGLLDYVKGETYRYTKNKKGTVIKVTLNGDKYYNVKSIKYHKNGFVKKVVYNNGNINNYNSDGLLTSAIAKTDKGAKYTYKYTKKNGKVVKIAVKRNGKKYSTIKLKYGKASTGDVWKYSCLIDYAGGPSNACELCSNCTLSGNNGLF